MHFLCINFTISTIGMTHAPSKIAMRYSLIPTLVRPNAPAITGTSQTTVVAIREIKAAPYKNLFEVFNLKILPR